MDALIYISSALWVFIPLVILIILRYHLCIDLFLVWVSQQKQPVEISPQTVITRSSTYRWIFITAATNKRRTYVHMTVDPFLDNANKLSLSSDVSVVTEGTGEERKNVGTTTDDDTTYYVRYASQRSVIVTYDPTILPVPACNAIWLSRMRM